VDKTLRGRLQLDIRAVRYSFKGKLSEWNIDFELVITLFTV